MKKFIFDRLVDAENLCNLKNEKNILMSHIDNRNKVVIYAPRNFGKTSLVKNVIIPNFKKQNKHSFVFFVDFMEVKDQNSIVSRLKNSFEHSFADSFPARNILENIKNSFQNIRPEITIDPITTQPSISLEISEESKNYSIEYIFQLAKEISDKYPALFVLDEFQDIANIPESQGIFRNIFETLGDVPIILMGSKRHILSQIFSKPDAPLALWGQDLEIKQIDYKEYHKYIQERFIQKKIKINFECSKYLQDTLWRIPEPINIICHQLMENYNNKTITEVDVNLAIKSLLENKESKYESYLSTFSITEEKICITLAENGEVEKPQSREFVSKCKVTSRTVGKVFERLMDKGIIEKYDTKYRLSDPLFNFYLNIYR